MHRHQQPLSSAKREASHAYVWATSRRRRQAERRRRSIHIVHQRTGLRARHPVPCVDFDSLHPGDIDHHAVIADRKPRSTVSSAAHGDRQLLFLGKIESARNINCARTTHDEGRVKVERSVKNQTGRFVLARIRRYNMSTNSSS